MCDQNYQAENYLKVIKFFIPDCYLKFWEVLGYQNLYFIWTKDSTSMPQFSEADDVI